MLLAQQSSALYMYSGYYSIVFDVHSQFSWSGKSGGKNVVIFGADMSSSVHADNKEKDILALGEVPTQGLDDTTLTAEAKYPINFTESGKSLHYNGSNSFFNAVKIY